MLHEVDWRAVNVCRPFVVDMVQVVDFRQRLLPPLAFRDGVSVQEDVLRLDEAVHAAVTKVMLEVERPVVGVTDQVDNIGHDVSRVIRPGNGACQEARLHSARSHLMQHV